jgi:uncharacterized protein (TIGR03437 family)
MRAYSLPAQQATIVEYPAPADMYGANGITAGADGNLWFTGIHNVGKISPAGAATEYATPPTWPGGDVAPGADGSLWFPTLYGIAKITTAGVITVYPASVAPAQFGGIASGPDGKMWFSDNRNNAIGSITADGAMSAYDIPTANAIPGGITQGPDGNLWFTEISGNRIGKITTSGVITEYVLPNADSEPNSITLGPDGSLWFTEMTGNRVGRITDSGAISEFALPDAGVSGLSGVRTAFPLAIMQGSDGYLWVAGGGGTIGRISTTGVVTMVPAPGAVTGIVQGPDGNIWFTDGGFPDGRIGKLVPSSLPGNTDFSVDHLALSFFCIGGTGPPTPLKLGVSAPVRRAFVAATTGEPWLSISPSGSLSTNQIVTVSADPAGLGVGAHTGAVQLTSGNVSQTVPVTLNVGGAVSLSGGPFNFSGVSGGTIGPDGLLTITSTVPGIPAVPFTISIGGGTIPLFGCFPGGGSVNYQWLVVTDPNGYAISGGMTPATIRVGVNAGCRPGSAFPPPGNYSCAITITPAGGIGLAVDVTLAVAAAPAITSVANAASFATGPLSPGEVVAITGSSLGPDAAIGAALDSAGKVATSLGSVSVSFGGYLAPLLYVSATQINCVVPYEAGALGVSTLQVIRGGAASNLYSLSSLVAAAPGVFTLNGSGTGTGAITNGSGGVNGPKNPAARGSPAFFYITGEGQTDPPGTTGQVTSVNTVGGGPLTPQPLLRVSVTVGGQPAAVTFAGEAPGTVAGILQVNIVVPSDLPPGDLPLVVSVGSLMSQDGVTVTVQ